MNVLCSKCNSPFLIRVSGPVEKNPYDNYDYFSNTILDSTNPTPLVNAGSFNAKLEYYSPTLSYKDRGMNVLFSYLREQGLLRKSNGFSEDSSGNAGASFAFMCNVLALRGKIYVSQNANKNKLDQIRSYKGEIVTVQGDRKSVEKAAMFGGETYLGHQYWPEFYDAFRTISYEIRNQMKEIPENIVIPFSTGTLYLGIFEGFNHLLMDGKLDKIPTLWAIQPEIASGMYDHLNNIKKDQKRSIADALTGVLPLRFEYIESIINSTGRCETITESEIVQAKLSLEKQGIDCEYSSAVTFAALKKFNLPNDTLLILTGHGIKNINQ